MSKDYHHWHNPCVKVQLPVHRDVKSIAIPSASGHSSKKASVLSNVRFTNTVLYEFWPPGQIRNLHWGSHNMRIKWKIMRNVSYIQNIFWGAAFLALGRNLRLCDVTCRIRTIEVHRRSQGCPGGHGSPKTFRISSHCVLWKAVTQTK